MKENLHEQLSALVDDELPQAEQALLLKQLGADAELRDRLARYQMISDSLGNHLPPQVDAGFHKEIHAALQDEPAVHVETAPRIAGLFKPVELKVHIVVVVDIVQSGYMITLLHQFFGQVKTNKSGSTSNYDFHLSLP